MERCPNCLNLWDGRMCSTCGYQPENRVRHAGALPNGTMLLGRYRLYNSLDFSRQALAYAAWDEDRQQPVLITELFPDSIVYRDSDTGKVIPAINQSQFQVGMKRYQEDRSDMTIPLLQSFFGNGTAYRVYQPLQNGVSLKKQAEWLMDHPIFFRDAQGKPMMSITCRIIDPLPAKRPYQKVESGSKKRKLLPLLLILLALVVAGVVFAIVSKPNPDEPTPPEIPPTESVTPVTETPNPEVTETPTEEPTEKPTEEPTEKPTVKPTEEPTEKPTVKPTEEPTEKPTVKPTEEPTEKPTERPTEKPTEAPTPTTDTSDLTEHSAITSFARAAELIPAPADESATDLSHLAATILDIKLKPDDGNQGKGNGDQSSDTDVPSGNEQTPPPDILNQLPQPPVHPKVSVELLFANAAKRAAASDSTASISDDVLEQINELFKQDSEPPFAVAINHLAQNDTSPIEMITNRVIDRLDKMFMTPSPPRIASLYKAANQDRISNLQSAQSEIAGQAIKQIYKVLIRHASLSQAAEFVLANLDTESIRNGIDNAEKAVKILTPMIYPNITLAELEEWGIINAIDNGIGANDSSNNTITVETTKDEIQIVSADEASDWLIIKDDMSGEDGFKRLETSSLGTDDEIYIFCIPKKQVVLRKIEGNFFFVSYGHYIIGVKTKQNGTYVHAFVPVSEVNNSIITFYGKEK